MIANWTGEQYCPRCGNFWCSCIPYYVPSFTFTSIRDPSKGWECPKCERVWSPDTEGCQSCNHGVV